MSLRSQLYKEWVYDWMNIIQKSKTFSHQKNRCRCALCISERTDCCILSPKCTMSIRSSTFRARRIIVGNFIAPFGNEPSDCGYKLSELFLLKEENLCHLPEPRKYTGICMGVLKLFVLSRSPYDIHSSPPLSTLFIVTFHNRVLD
jgi:hypothetical protein